MSVSRTGTGRREVPGMDGRMKNDKVRYLILGLLFGVALFVLMGAATNMRIGKYQVAVTISAGAATAQQVVVAVIDTETGVVNLNRHEFAKITQSR
ncbi:MAG: hypothetical protein A2177_02210 [Spirochaetes bacterium RBG_13_68_11]|nr:MAG: hypothetical protein A2177_02210 [Spirochaetes bacterium RBG_13_68_11]